MDNTKDQTIAGLRSSVQAIDGLSQMGFSKIYTLAELALATLESPRSCNDFELIAAALSAISEQAQYSENEVNVQAEAVACAYQDFQDRQRSALRHLARDPVASVEKGAQ